MMVSAPSLLERNCARGRREEGSEEKRGGGEGGRREEGEATYRYKVSGPAEEFCGYPTLCNGCKKTHWLVECWVCSYQVRKEPHPSCTSTPGVFALACGHL